MILTAEQLARVVQLASGGSKHVEDWQPVEIVDIDGRLLAQIPGDPTTVTDLGERVRA